MFVLTEPTPNPDALKYKLRYVKHSAAGLDGVMTIPAVTGAAFCAVVVFALKICLGLHVDQRVRGGLTRPNP